MHIALLYSSFGDVCSCIASSPETVAGITRHYESHLSIAVFTKRVGQDDIYMAMPGMKQSPYILAEEMQETSV